MNLFLYRVFFDTTYTWAQKYWHPKSRDFTSKGVPTLVSTSVGRIRGKIIHFGHWMNKMIKQLILNCRIVRSFKNRTTFLRFEYRIPSPLNCCNNTLEWHHWIHRFLIVSDPQNLSQTNIHPLRIDTDWFPCKHNLTQDLFSQRYLQILKKSAIEFCQKM